MFEIVTKFQHACLCHLISGCPSSLCLFVIVWNFIFKRGWNACLELILLVCPPVCGGLCLCQSDVALYPFLSGPAGEICGPWCGCHPGDRGRTLLGHEQ